MRFVDTAKYGLAAFLFFFFAWSLAAGNSILLKVVAVNPSKESTQKIQVKAYLPQEVKPEHIIDKGDLQMSYDTQQRSYYVFNEYELKPMEVLERAIEITDMWVIPDDEINSLIAEADKITGLLKSTEFEERAKFLLESIKNKLKAIDENQKNPAPNPEKHISDYRDNVKLLESVKVDLAMIRSFLSLAKPLPPVAVWRAIVIIFVFLGGLGLTLYLVWTKQLKAVTTDDTFYVPGEEKKQDQAHSTAKEEKKP